MRALGFVVLASAAAAGCAGDETVKSFAEATGLATTAQEAKPFVQASRPVDPAFIPISRTIAVNPLCAGPTPAPAYVPTGPNARYAAPPPERRPADACKPRAKFEQIEAQLEAKRLSNDAAGSQARALGQALPAPAPAVVAPTN